MIIREAIVLAGGLGTRLKSALPDIPKCLAPVVGKPFIQFVIQHLQLIGIQRFVFALGYQANSMIEALNSIKQQHEFIYSVEEKPLGTGGSIKQALQYCNDENVLIVNGDTFFSAMLNDAVATHTQQEAACTLLLKAMQDCSRYGTVTVDNENRVIGFGEKNNTGSGLISAGMYLLNIPLFQLMDWPVIFSFEQDYLQALVASTRIYGVASDAYFIDIGIPEDYDRAKVELPLVVGL